MKKFNFIGFIVLAIVIIAASCQKEEDPPAQVTKYKSTLTGFAYAQLDETIQGMELVPQGTRIFAIVPTQQLILTPDPNTVYPNKIYETTVGADGKYSFTFDVGCNGEVQTMLYANDFEYDRIISPSVTELTYYNMSAIGVILIPKQTKIFNIQFTY